MTSLRGNPVMVLAATELLPHTSLDMLSWPDLHGQQGLAGVRACGNAWPGSAEASGCQLW